MTNDLYFENIREYRGSYFVEYKPPIAGNLFATLSIIFPDPVEWEQVAECLDNEVRRWIERYPVPLMAWAWDNKEDVIRPPGLDSDCLVAWTNPVSGEIEQSWELEDLSAFLSETPLRADWQTIYADIPFRTKAEVETDAREVLLVKKRRVRFLKFILMCWLVLIPAGYAVFEFLGPAWLGVMGFVLVLWNALNTALRIWGRVKPSERDQEDDERQRKMNHYYYHCERNPEGFQRVMVENIEDDARERIRKEANDLADNAGP